MFFIVIILYIIIYKSVDFVTKKLKKKEGVLNILLKNKFYVTLINLSSLYNKNEPEFKSNPNLKAPPGSRPSVRSIASRHRIRPPSPASVVSYRYLDA